jgi:hypothetical protein
LSKAGIFCRGEEVSDGGLATFDQKSAIGSAVAQYATAVSRYGVDRTSNFGPVSHYGDTVARSLTVVLCYGVEATGNFGPVLDYGVDVLR